MIIHAFFLCFLGIALYGHAVPAQIRSSCTVVKPVFKQDHSHSVDNKTEHQDSHFCLNQRIRLSIVISSFSVLKENDIVLLHCNPGKHKSVMEETEEKLYDHLLHLFPSHYFW